MLYVASETARSNMQGIKMLCVAKGLDLVQLTMGTCWRGSGSITGFIGIPLSILILGQAPPVKGLLFSTLQQL